MPIYEYVCEKCNTKFEELVKNADSPNPSCSKCGGSTKRLFPSNAGLQFKGTGFYITDYVKNNKSKNNSDNKKE